MSLNSKLLKAAPLVIAFSMIIALLACQSDLPLKIEHSNNAGNVTILKVKNHQVRLNKLFSTQKWIDDNGGSIVVGDYEDGYSYLKFPVDAINENDYPKGVLIDFVWESDAFLQADFYPEGLTFDKPVTISLSYKNADLIGIAQNNLGIYYYNPLSDNWEAVNGSIVNTERKSITAYINHFSRYAIGME